MNVDNEVTPIDYMTRAKNGDTEAFSLLYEQYFVPVYRYIYKRAGNKHDAEDISQTVFLKVFKSKTIFADQGKSPLAYFLTTARHALADHWKKRKMVVGLEEVGGENDNLLEKIMNQAEVLSLLSKLPERERNVISMKFLEGYKTNDIAKVLDTSPANVRQIQCRALRFLRTRHLERETKKI